MAKKNNQKEVIKKKEVIKEKRYLIIGVLYLGCALLWIIGGACKLMVKESYLLDIILGLVLLALSFIYFKKYNSGRK